MRPSFHTYIKIMNIKVIPILVTAFLLNCFTLSAQETESGDNTSKVPIRISYYGDNLKHPGLRIGSSLSLARKVKVKTRRNRKPDRLKKPKTKVIEYTLDGNFGFYTQPNNHFGIPVGIGLSRYKTINERRFSTGWSIEINYLQRLYNIDTYVIDEDGNIEELGAAGNGGLAFTLAPVLQRSFGQKDLIVFIKPMMQLNKYNHAFAVNYSAEFGISLNLLKK